MWKWIKEAFKPAQKSTVSIPEPKYDDNLRMVRGSLKWYGYLWDQAQLREDPKNKRMIENAVLKIKSRPTRYKEVALRTGVPWWVIACLHVREANGDFNCILHNGEQIIGDNVKTKLIPQGRGPFATWEEAAIDALSIEQLPVRWSIEETLMFMERYNGTGYLKYHPEVLSPYLWSGTTLYSGHGKYVSDGKFSINAVELQCGTAAMIKSLGNMIQLTRVQYK
jgi:lysozyme family protein